MGRITKGVSLVWILAMVFASQALAGPRTAQQLESDLGTGVDVTVQDETGVVGFITTEAGEPIQRPARTSGDAAPSAIAGAFVAGLERELGLRDAAADLEVVETSEAGRGRSTVEFQQLVDGVPVIGGELRVGLDRAGDVLFLAGETVPRAQLDTEPVLSAAQADDIALGFVARGLGVDGSTLEASPGELSVYDSRLLGGPGLEVPTLVWRFEVTSTEAAHIREFVLVDAIDGGVVMNFNMIPHAKDRSVCDAGNDTNQVPCAAPVRTEGGGAVADSAGVFPGDVNAIYDYGGDTYDHFFDNYGFDSLDGAGLPILATADYCEVGPSAASCPGQFFNAFWDGSQIVFGDGFGLADDVVGHEFAHGFTENTNGLFYYYQSGAINESLSDVFGELVDLENGEGSDTPADRWKLGEDVGDEFFPSACTGSGHEIRNLSDPTVCGNPDAMDSPLYFSDLGGNDGDSGGVHINSGVNNKAFSLMTDGGTHNSQTVTGIGETKSGAIYFEVATNLLGTGSDYADLYSALQQGCANLASTGEKGITSADCDQVKKAADAVKMNLNPPAAPTFDAAPVEETCVSGESVLSIFSDDMEAAVNEDWGPLTFAGVNTWDVPVEGYAPNGANILYSSNQGATSDTAAVLVNPKNLVPGSYMRWEQFFGFEDFNGVFFDGGVIEYTTDGGATWSDLGPMIEVGGYNGTISPSNGNPLAGRDGYVDESAGYGASRANLASIGAQPFQVSFRMGTDSVFGDFGWGIDDFEIFACEPETTVGSIGKTPKNRPTIDFTNSSSATNQAECKVDNGTSFPCLSGDKLSKLADGRHTLTVTAIGENGTPDQTPATENFEVTASACKKAKKQIKKSKKLKKKAKKASGKKAKKLKKKSKKLKKKGKKAKKKNC